MQTTLSAEQNASLTASIPREKSGKPPEITALRKLRIATQKKVIKKYAFEREYEAEKEERRSRRERQAAHLVPPGSAAAIARAAASEAVY